MKNPSTLAYYGAIMIVCAQICRVFLFNIFELFDYIFNYFLSFIDIIGMLFIANYFRKLHQQQKATTPENTIEFKE